MYRRTVDKEVLEFGVSGVLRFSNLVMYDRKTQSWWQEFTGEAIVGDLTGKKMERLAQSLVSWNEFKSTYPNGRVLSRNTGYDRPYGENPYTLYDTSQPFLYSGPDDRRLPAMERVVAVEIGEDSLAIPFSELGKNPVVHVSVGDKELVVFYRKGTASALDTSSIASGRDVGAAGVFDSNLDGRKLTFKRDGDHIVDQETWSRWNLLGQAEYGPMIGKSLSPISHLNPFWFAWAAYKPNTEIYRSR
ncbi:MAG: DUF3179 domain-containing protein [Chloroflexi bacterium]|nr:DUF3179 domain-containing protein [Chloroflexota bacterium]